jgi:hypothetical protein
MYESFPDTQGVAGVSGTTLLEKGREVANF